ncbi:uncharacterized protein LOC141594872 [Silene latifolia]|uniref:uncharacterized protein LOC141594872 n=1 Tax=Silene latifolia TaxID=37657 RepID=UPI003D782EE9
MKGLAWNCRGLNDPLAPSIPKIKAICRSFHNNLDFVFLSETQCDVRSIDVLLRPMGFLQSAGCDADGLKGEGVVGWMEKQLGAVWEDFSRHLNSFDKPFLFFGDFNQVEFSSDKLGGSDKLIRGANLFSYWKNVHCLMDIPFKGPRFTWCNNRDNPHRIYERLDKGFASNDCLSLFPNTFIKHMPIKISDHAPIILDTNMILHTKKKTYRLEAWCFDYAECSVLRVKGRSSDNLILGIKKESNEWTFDMKEIGGLFNKYFSDIFKSDAEPESFEDYINNYSYLFDNLKRKVGMEERAKLGHIYSKNEVRQAVFQLGPLKSPGPDGIPAAFYQKYWSIVKDDVINGALNILNSGTVLKEFNKTFIVLIPKNDCPERVGDFRPISLCNVIMKVVTKCIANRLKGVMDDLVSPFQSAFVPNRSIADNIDIAQEILHVINLRVTVRRV